MDHTEVGKSVAIFQVCNVCLEYQLSISRFLYLLKHWPRSLYAITSYLSGRTCRWFIFRHILSEVFGGGTDFKTNTCKDLCFNEMSH